MNIFNSYLKNIFVPISQRFYFTALSISPLLSIQNSQINLSRSRILYSRTQGKPETVQSVINRFYRLNNGLWIRPKAGRKKKQWCKSLARLHRSKEHVFCNKTQCSMLDKMVNMEYKIPHYYVNDPYEHYHRKSNLPGVYRSKPPKFLP